MPTLIRLAASLLLAPLAAAAFAPTQGPSRHLTAEGLAFGGGDPVACFPAGGAKAVPGDAKLELQVGPARYRFASAEHRAWFQSEPARYEPAYGGFDAAAMVTGERKASAAGAFRVAGGRLFAFADAAAAQSFDAAAIVRADASWKQLSGEAPRGAAADDARVGVKWNVAKDGLALEGYDPVSYFPEGGSSPVKGDAKLETVQDGARYRFASEAHRAWFTAEPARYRPKYGGWCAYAMVDGDDVEVDPKSFLIEDGRLLLFYKGFLADTRAKWIPKTKEFAPKADAQWAKHR